MERGAFIVSLDFELHWGGFEKWPVENYRRYFLNTRSAIPEILRRFSGHGVHATWAAVGLLFHRNRGELLANLPVLRPSYVRTELSPYEFIQEHGIGVDEETDPLHYAWSLLEKIRDTPGQEIGSHTFGHFYCNEAGQTPEQFKADLMAAQKAASRLGITLQSLVFPRNQFNEDYLRVCTQCGISSVRSNPRDWFWDIQSTTNESYWKRINRGLDAYLPLGKENTFPLQSIPVREGLPLSIPASRLLRPYRPGEFFLNGAKVRRIAGEMSRAAERGHVYHLWWHPHNFGSYPEESLRGLDEILQLYEKISSRTGMRSMTMKELTAEIMDDHAKKKTA